MENQKNYDVTIARPEKHYSDIIHKGTDMDKKRLKSIKKGLKTFHTLEVMAVNIYKYQITHKRTEINKHLIAAMFNEMTHEQDFVTALYEYSMRPSIMVIPYMIVGFVFGSFSRIRGQKAILKMGIWVESKAVRHYQELLDTIKWDDDTRKTIEKNQADEDQHIKQWKELLNKM